MLHLEQWQQETVLATAMRLVVAGMACVLVWKLGRDERPEGQTLRAILVRLRGRLVKRAGGYGAGVAGGGCMCYSTRWK